MWCKFFFCLEFRRAYTAMGKFIYLPIVLKLLWVGFRQLIAALVFSNFFGGYTPPPIGRFFVFSDPGDACGNIRPEHSLSWSQHLYGPHVTPRVDWGAEIQERPIFCPISMTPSTQHKVFENLLYGQNDTGESRSD